MSHPVEQVDGALQVMRDALQQALARKDAGSVLLSRERIDVLLDARNAGTLARHPEVPDTLPKGAPPTEPAGRHAQ